MPRKKSSPEQGTLVAAFPPGPAELPADPKPEPKPAEKPSPSNGQIDLAVVRDMGERFARHAANLRELDADVKLLVELGWPISDPDAQDNLVEQLTAMIEPVEYETAGMEVIECDGTIAATISDVQELADDLLPGPKEGVWVKVLADAPAELPRVVGMPDKNRKKAK
jgi:hypothetical protein